MKGSFLKHQEENSQKTQIIVLKKVVNLGNVKQKSTSKAELVIINVGENNLKIKNSQPDCSCTVVKSEKNIIPPKDSLILKIDFDSKENLGYFMKKILIELNADESPLILVLKGKVVE